MKRTVCRPAAWFSCSVITQNVIGTSEQYEGLCKISNPEPGTRFFPY